MPSLHSYDDDTQLYLAFSPNVQGDDASAIKANNNNNDNNDLLTDPLGGSSLLNYINYNYKINQIKLFTNYTVEAGLTESNNSKN